jgi:hypothetical protein
LFFCSETSNNWLLAGATREANLKADIFLRPKSQSKSLGHVRSFPTGRRLGCHGAGNEHDDIEWCPVSVQISKPPCHGHLAVIARADLVDVSFYPGRQAQSHRGHRLDEFRTIRYSERRQLLDGRTEVLGFGEPKRKKKLPSNTPPIRIPKKAARRIEMPDRYRSMKRRRRPTLRIY